MEQKSTTKVDWCLHVTCS